jgi:hypothetical protein
MNHPNEQELTGFLYDDGIGAERMNEIRAHLATCAQCRSRMAAWRGVRQELATWELPDVFRGHGAGGAPRRRFLQPVLKWSVAAAVLIAGGIALARVGHKPPDMTALRAQIAGEIRAELGAELAAAQAQFASQQSARDEEFEQAVARAMVELEARQVVAHAALRKDVETLAIRAQQGFEQIAYSGRTVRESGAPQQ